MDEMPGMIRPDLQALPQVKDRMTFLYLEHCTLAFPRMRGGDPFIGMIYNTGKPFSPHARG